MIFSEELGSLNSTELEDLSLEAMELVDEVTKAFFKTMPMMYLNGYFCVPWPMGVIS